MRWHGITGAPRETDPDKEPSEAQEPISFPEQELDTSCRQAPTTLFRVPREETRLDLSPNERRAAARRLRCPPWEIGPCIRCAAPIHRYGRNHAMACLTCRTPLNQP